MVLWIVQILLAAIFGGIGVVKLTQPKEKLHETMGWTNAATPLQVKAIGALELLAGIGLFLPALTGIATVLTPLAALGLIIIMIGGIVVHLHGVRTETLAERRKVEIQGIVTCAVLLVLAALVAWGRFGPYAL
ncbi:DoxX family protein [Micromonospora violae]